MSDLFKIKIIDQKWLDEDFICDDLCSHGPIYLQGNNFMLTDESDGDWGISESALALLRTLKYNFPNQQFDETIIFHGCGTILMMSCPITISWDVKHLDQKVILNNFRKTPTTNYNDTIRYDQIHVEIDLKSYAQEIFNFAQEVKSFFSDIHKNYEKAETIEGEYLEFWREFDDLFRFAEKIMK